MKPLALSVALNALLPLLALIAYDQVARMRELRVAVVDVAAVYRWKEAQFTVLLTQPGSAANAPQLAADFARRLPQALDEIATECQCLLLTRAVLRSAVFQDADLTLADCSDSDLYQGNFTRVKAPRGRFRNCDLTYADFSHADVEGADFSGARMFRAVLHRTRDAGAFFTNRALALGDDPELARAEDFTPPR